MAGGLQQGDYLGSVLSSLGIFSFLPTRNKLWLTLCCLDPRRSPTLNTSKTKLLPGALEVTTFLLDHDIIMGAGKNSLSVCFCNLLKRLCAGLPTVGAWLTSALRRDARSMDDSLFRAALIRNLPRAHFTRFNTLKEKPPYGYTWSGRRLTRKQTTSRHDKLWPKMWKHMSDASKRKEKRKMGYRKTKT